MPQSEKKRTGKRKETTAVSERVLTLAKSGSSGSHVVNDIGRAIVSGKFTPHNRLPDEQEMLDTYSISRTALREAYSKLAAKGLIVARPKVGTSVRPSTFWNMLDPDVLGWHLQTKPASEISRDLYALRQMIEPSAASIAAKNRTDADVERIQSAFEAMVNSAQDEQQLVEADLRFHLEILFATQNPFIGAFSALIHAAMMSIFEISWRATKSQLIKQERLNQHKLVLDAIRDGDADRAQAAMQALLDDSINDVRGALNDGQ